MSNYKIIQLLCSSTPENIELAEQICISQSWDILEIIKQYGYNDLGIRKPDDFLQEWVYCINKNITALPALLPFSIIELKCYNNKLTHLPVLPPNLIELDCTDNQLTYLPVLPPYLKFLYCSGN